MSLQSLSELVEQRNEKVAAHKDPDLPYVGLEHLAQNSPTLLGTIPASSSTSTNSVFKPGDILFGKLRPNLRKSLQVDFAGYCSTDILVLHARSGVEPGFAARVLQREAVFDEAVRTAVGTKMPRTSWDNLGAFKVVTLPLSEQRRIAEILDAADASIEETAALISKLKQMKAGLTHDLLTCGLDERWELRDPDANPEQFKDSPLSRIPREWEVKYLRELTDSAVDGPFGSNLKTEHYVDWPEVRVIRLQNIAAGRFDDRDKAYISQSHALTLQRHTVLPGDLLVASLGDEHYPIGRACLYPDNGGPAVNKADCFRLRFHSPLLSEAYAMYTFNCSSTREDIGLLGQGVTRDRINLTSLLTVRIRVPPLEEQHRIAEILDAHDDRIRAEEAYRDKLRLQKAGLMDDLLTGRVRVNAAEEVGA